MFDDLFNGFKDFIGSQVQKAVSEVEKLFAIPEPVEPFTLVRQFTLDDSTVSQGGISIFGGNWQIEAYDDGDGIKNFQSTQDSNAYQSAFKFVPTRTVGQHIYEVLVSRSFTYQRYEVL